MKKIFLNNQISSYLYEQVSGSIEIMIENGSLQPGARIPSEKELCQLFDTSRITVRRAIKELNDRGILEVVHGKGTFVRDHALHHSHEVDLNQCPESLGLNSAGIRKTVLKAGPRSANNREKEIFDSNQVFEVLRLLSDGEGPFGLDVALFAHKRYEGLKNKIKAESQIAQVLQEEYQEDIRRADLRMEYGQGEAFIAETMDLPGSTLFLKMERQLVNEAEEVVEVSHFYFLPSRIKLTMARDFNPLNHDINQRSVEADLDQIGQIRGELQQHEP